MNGETSIQRLIPFSVEHPDLVVAYAVNNGLQDSRPFRWTKRYQALDNGDTLFSLHHQSIEVQSLLASRFSAHPKYKFGVQVPCSLRHALYLDKIHGDNLWRLAIDKELNEIDSFGTFRSTTSDDT